MRKFILVLLCFTSLSVLANTPPQITNVRASQRANTKLVDIYYDAADADGDSLKIRIEISDNDGARYSVPAFSLTGDIGEGVAPGNSKHIVWDAGTDWDGEYSDRMRVKVFAIDAKGFPGMEWGDEVPPGGFLLGQDGGAEGSGPSRHVNIPWSYWMGKYEVTCQQYCDFLNAALAAGVVRKTTDDASVYSVRGNMLIQYMTGSYLLLKIGDDYDIRWNVNNFEVVGDKKNCPVSVTWHGAIAFAHFYGYDLPTEAEWEKAARGPDNDDQDEHLVYTWGNELSKSYANYNTGEKTPVGYYDGNQTPIGPDTKNGYGLYDMIGNVAEWMLTNYKTEVAEYPQYEDIMSLCNQYYYGIDVSYSYRGGDYSSSTPAIYKRSGSKSGYSRYIGFRVVRRKDIVRPTAVCEFKEDFESWPVKTSFGEVTVTTGAGEWKMDDELYLNEDVSIVASGRKCLRGNGFSSSQLYLPSLKNRLVELRMKVRNTSSGSQSVYLYSGNDKDGYTSRSILISEYSDWHVISLCPTADATTYRIYAGNSNLYIDDLEIWTVPRTAE